MQMQVIEVKPGQGALMLDDEALIQVAATLGETMDDVIENLPADGQAAYRELVSQIDKLAVVVHHTLPPDEQ